MLPDIFDSAEKIATSGAAIVMSIGGLLLYVRNYGREKKHQSEEPMTVVHGQKVTLESDYLAHLKEEAEAAPILRRRLQKALLRLSDNDLPYRDI